MSRMTRTSTILRVRLANLNATYQQAIKAAERDEWRERQRKSRLARAERAHQARRSVCGVRG